ncbi:hypothetical protein ABQF34_22865 [Mycolicibacterium boenickei]
MNSIDIHQFSDSVSCDGDLVVQHGRRRSTRRRVVGAALTAAFLFGGLAGVNVIGGAGEASAKPMERERVRYCAKLQRDVDFTKRAFITAYDKYGPQDRLTIQAASNYERAESRLAGSGC